MRAAVGAWYRFWFRDIDDDTFVLVRTALGAVLLVWGLTLLVDLYDFQGVNGLVPDREPRQWQPTAFRWVSGDVALGLLWTLLIVSGLALLIGRVTRVGAVGAVISIASLQQDNPLILNAGDELLRITTVYVAVVLLLAGRRAPVRPLFGTRARARRSTMPIWGLRLLQIQLTVVYPATVIRKLDGSTWINGRAVGVALDLARLQRFAIPDAITESLLASRLMTWTTLTLEILLPVLLWVPFTRRLAIGLGIALHCGFSIVMRLGVFTPAMIVNYLAFLSPEAVRRTVDRMEARFGLAPAPRAPPLATIQPVSSPLPESM